MIQKESLPTICQQVWYKNDASSNKWSNWRTLTTCRTYLKPIARNYWPEIGSTSTSSPFQMEDRDRKGPKLWYIRRLYQQFVSRYDIKMMHLATNGQTGRHFESVESDLRWFCIVFCHCQQFVSRYDIKMMHLATNGQTGGLSPLAELTWSP